LEKNFLAIRLLPNLSRDPAPLLTIVALVARRQNTPQYWLNKWSPAAQSWAPEMCGHNNM